jgi:carbamoyltransferase
VDRGRNPLLHALLDRFFEKTDCPVLINTSFNVRSEPIVCSPEDAYRCFMLTEMDVLVMGRHILRKQQQHQMTQQQRDQHLAQFQLD